MTHRLISVDQADDWWSCLGRAAADCVPGPSFEPGYAALHANEGNRLEAFFFASGGHSYFVPYVRKPISSDLSHDEFLFAIESPYGYAGIIASTEDRSFLTHAWQEFTLRMKETGVVAALLRFDPLLQTHRYYAGHPDDLIAVRDVVTPHLSVDEDVLLAGCKSSVRNKINKARRAGVMVRASVSVEDSMAFVPLYEATMDRLSATDFYRFQPAYFEDLFRRKDVACLIAELDDAPIGGIVGVRYGNNAIVHLSATKDLARTNGTANLLRYMLMLSMAQSGCTRINFGGGKTDDEEDQLLSYKKGFSDETERYYLAKCQIDAAWHRELLHRWRLSGNFDEARVEFFLPYVD